MFIINSESNFSLIEIILNKAKKNLSQNLKKISLILRSVIKNTKPRYHQGTEGIGSSLVVVCGF